MFKVGAHLSASGGIENARQRMLAIGADCVQVFASAPLRWEVKDPGSFQEPVTSFFHACYLINLSGPDELFEKSIQAMINHLSVAEREGSEGLVFHPGSKGPLERISEGIQRVLEKTKGNLILENSANKAGMYPDDVFKIMDLVSSPRLQFCLDTAHAFEAGQLDAEWPEPVLIHANDSLTAEGSRHDRHARIGQGLIGKDKFLSLLKKYNSIPWVMETPDGATKEDVEDLRNLWIQSKL